MACERSSRFRNITTEAPFCEFEGLRLSAYHLLPSYATFFALSNFFFWRAAIFVNIGRNGSDARKPENKIMKLGTFDSLFEPEVERRKSEASFFGERQQETAHARVNVARDVVLLSH